MLTRMCIQNGIYIHVSANTFIGYSKVVIQEHPVEVAHLLALPERMRVDGIFPAHFRVLSFFLMASAKFLRAVWQLSGQMVSIGQATTVDVQSFATDISNVSATVRLLIPIPATAASRLSNQLPGRTCATILPILLPS